MKLSLLISSALTVHRTDYTRIDRVIDSAIDHAKRHPGSVIETACIFAPCELRTWDASAVESVRMVRRGDLY